MPGLSGYKGTDKPKRAFYKSDEAYEKDLKLWKKREAKKKKASGSAGDVASPKKKKKKKTDRMRKAMRSQKKY